MTPAFSLTGIAKRYPHFALQDITLDLPEGNAMRAPGEAPGMMALEVAMDEMAEKLGLDPVAFRILNDTRSDPENPDRPFSQRQLKTCLELGAARFGWGARKPAPGVVRDGRWLIGMGVGELATRRGLPFDLQPWQALFVIGALPALLSVLVMVKLKEPEVFGIPEIKPPEDRDKPAGREPDWMTKDAAG